MITHDIMDYMIDLPIKGTKTILVKNCKSKAEARKKLLDFEHNQPDCENIEWRIDRIFFKSGKMVLAKEPT